MKTREKESERAVQVGGVGGWVAEGSDIWVDKSAAGPTIETMRRLSRDSQMNDVKMRTLFVSFRFWENERREVIIFGKVKRWRGEYQPSASI